MRSNSFRTDPNSGCHWNYSSSINKSSNDQNAKHYYNLNLIRNADSVDDFIAAKTAKKNSQLPDEILCSPTSVYDNCNGEMKIDQIRDNTRQPRQPRQHNAYEESRLYGLRGSAKRDLSVPPINSRERYNADDNLFSQYLFPRTKLSIDGDLDSHFDLQDPVGTEMYDSVVSSVSVTPPPVQMVHEYANRKAIIRPLAFKPVKVDRSHNALEGNNKVLKGRIGQSRRASPPPVPPHGNRIMIKSGLGRVQSLKSGDSSGYYSSRTACTANGNTSSADISPTFDDNVSMIDSILTGEIYANTIASTEDYPTTEEETLVVQSSLELELTSERELNKTLESAFSKSSAKLLGAENQINELKMRLSQKVSEVNNTLKTLSLYKRNLEHQCQKSLILERSIQSLKSERCVEKVMEEKSSQTNSWSGEHTATDLFNQFEEERKTWLDEKLKVLTYQKQIETNFQKLLIKCRRMEAQLGQFKGLVKEFRSPRSSNHPDDHEKSSLNSGDSSSHSYFTNISRIESI